MQSFKLKVNGDYVKAFKETEENGNFTGNWHNHTNRLVNYLEFGLKEDAQIIEGKRNLKSYIERITTMMNDDVDIQSFEFVRVEL